MAELSASEPLIVTYQGRQVRFEHCGGGIETELRRGRFYEMQMLQYIEALALAGAYVDVGGGVGTHALFFAAFCPSTRVHTFEPRPKYSASIERHVDANGLSDRVVVHDLGLSSRNETLSVELDGKPEQIECVPLDDVVTEPVSVMKIDVEGMEAAVLGGATRILRESKPVIFVEAHTDEELQRDAAVLEPHGYRLTGRVFNSAPTYEFAAADSRMAPVQWVIEARSLMNGEAWVSDHPAVEVDCSGGKLVVRSRLEPGATAYVTQLPADVNVPPGNAWSEVSPNASVFLQAGGSWGRDAKDLGTVLHLMQYDERGARTHVSRPLRHQRLFWKAELQSGTRRVRVALRVQGSGVHELERLALHVAAT